LAGIREFEAASDSMKTRSRGFDLGMYAETCQLAIQKRQFQSVLSAVNSQFRIDSLFAFSSQQVTSLRGGLIPMFLGIRLVLAG
jgi:hypothetical protein